MTTVIVQDRLYLPALREAFPGVAFLELDKIDAPIVDDRVGLIIGRPMPKDDKWMHVAASAEYVHFTSTGYDELLPEWLEGRTLTTAKGTNAVPVAEFAVACVLARAKNIPAVWEKDYSVSDRPLGTLQDCKIAVLGYGTVGETVVDMLRPFSQNIVVFRRQISATAPAGVTFSDDIDDVLKGSSHVVLTLELTELTRNILSAERIARLGNETHIVNVGRAALVDQAALTKAATAGAVLVSLDVTAPEPLPENHPLRSAAHARLSPHVAWSGPQVKSNRTELAIHNIGAWLTGGERKNVVLSPSYASR